MKSRGRISYSSPKSRRSPSSPQQTPAPTRLWLSSPAVASNQCTRNRMHRWHRAPPTPKAISSYKNNVKSLRTISNSHTTSRQQLPLLRQRTRSLRLKSSGTTQSSARSFRLVKLKWTRLTICKGSRRQIPASTVIRSSAVLRNQAWKWCFRPCARESYSRLVSYRRAHKPLISPRMSS